MMIKLRRSTLQASPKASQAGMFCPVTDMDSDTQLQSMLRIGQRRLRQKLVSDADIQDVMDTLLQTLEEFYPEMMGSILLLDEQEQCLRHLSAPRLPSEYNELIDGFKIGPKSGSCGTAAYLRQRVIVSNIEVDPLWSDIPEAIGTALKYNLRACWSQPIFSAEDQVLGTFALYYTSPRIPSDKEIELLETAAELAGLAIEWKRVEYSLRESEERFTAMADASPIMIGMSNVDGNITFLSKSWFDFLGAGPQDVLGRNWLEFIHPDDRAASFLNYQNVLQTGQSFEEEFRFRRFDGEYRWLHYVAAIQRDPLGRFLGCIGSSFDVTDQRAAQQKTENANRQKSQFLAKMSHEFRTPLNAVMGYSAMLTQGLAGQLSDKQTRYVQNIATSGQYLLNLVNDILDLSKVEAGQVKLCLENIRLESAFSEVETVVWEMAKLKNISLRFEVSPQVQQVWADPARLKQILLNLVSNAIKFNKEAGSVLVKVFPSLNREFTIFEVTDTGVGIPQGAVAKLFTEFYQVGNTQQKEGTGLGLALVKNLVELHGGSIWVDSTEGVGSRFTFKLPVKLPVVQQEAAFSLGNIA